MKKDKRIQHKAPPHTFVFRAMAGKLSVASVNAPDLNRAREMLENILAQTGKGALLALWEECGKKVKRG